MKNLTYSAKQSSKSNQTLYAVLFFYVKGRTKTIFTIAFLEKKLVFHTGTYDYSDIFEIYIFEI